MSQPKELTAKDMSQFYAKMRAIIAKSGHMVLGVGSDGTSTPFAYSIGLSEAGLPELLLALPINYDAMVLAVNEVAARLKKREKAFGEREQLDIEFSTPVIIRNPTDMDRVRRDYTIQVGQFYRRQDYAVQQIIFPDPHGLWPWDEGYAMGDTKSDLAMRLQPML